MLDPGAISDLRGFMANPIQAMRELTRQLQQLETEMDPHQFEDAGPGDSLGQNPAHAFATITEFKAAIDRMRYLTWMYMEAAARSTNVPVQAVPRALRRHMQGRI